MSKKMIALLGASLMLALAFVACRFPGAGGGAPAAGLSTPAVPIPTGEPVDPSVPTNTDGAETIVIPGGTFWMGSEETDALADEDERPRHQVTLGTFPIYTHEVTQGMYTRCVEARECIPIQVMESGPTSHSGDAAFDEHPITGVDWLMARDYCRWAGARLPTEAEWERASRALDSLPYPWGEEEPACDRVNMLGCQVPPDTLAAGSLANGNSAEGVWDLSGNAWEWVQDWYDPDYYALSPAASPLGPNLPEDPSDPLKVVRGGGLYSEPVQMRGAARQAADPNRPYDDVGFRCVAQPELDPPPGYAPVDERHEWVLPDPLDGGGETVEDPDGDIPWYSSGRVTVSCPDAEGRMHLFVGADSSEAVEYEVYVNDNLFDCTYDEMLRGLQCEGPIPENNDELAEYTVEVHFLPHGGIATQYPDRPLDCPVGGVPPFDVSASVGCPDAGGWVTAVFNYEPPIVWSTTQVDDGGAYEDMACWPLGDSTMNCLVPARAAGDPYTFHLRGTDADGRVYETWLTAMIPLTCAPMSFVAVEPLCFEDYPTVEIHYSPDTLVLASASASGTPLACFGMAPGVQICGSLPGDPGSPTTITTCFEGEACQDWPVTVPGCPEEFVEFVYGIEPACYPSLGPVVTIGYTPAVRPLVAANANGFDLTCVDAPTPGLYMCYTLPGAAGSTMTITFCLDDGSCHSSDISVPDCGIEAVPFDDGLAVSSFGCHSETAVYFVLQTTLEWLAGGTPFTYTASDGDTDYVCSLHPTIEHALYCSGEQPDAAGTLEVCLQQAGAPAPICQSFPGWPAIVTAIGDCAPPDEFSCSSITNVAACDADPRCQWQKGGSPAYPTDGCYPEP